MGVRFHRSLGVLPGVRVNFSKGLPSLSVGRRGLHYTLGARGNRLTAGLPGTGLSYTDYERHGNAEPAKGRSAMRRLARHSPLFGFVLFASLMLVMWGWSVSQDQATTVGATAAHMIPAGQ